MQHAIVKLRRISERSFLEILPKTVSHNNSSKNCETAFQTCRGC